MAGNGWPKTLEQLREEGYQIGNHDNCRGCQAVMLWARTPNDKAMPLTVLTEDVTGAATVKKYQPHFADCIARDQFRRGKNVTKNAK